MISLKPSSSGISAELVPKNFTNESNIITSELHRKVSEILLVSEQTRHG